MAVSNVRMPDEVYERLKALAGKEARSINDVAVEILDRGSRRQLARLALADFRNLRDEIRSKHGVMPDSVLLVREIREGRTPRG